MQPWSVAELAGFLRRGNTDRLGQSFEVLAACGLRRGEAHGLRCSHLDLPNRTARIRQTVVDVAAAWSSPRRRPARRRRRSH
jgi:integrase